MKRYFLFFLCITLLVLSGCAREQDALIGSWQGTVDLSDAINTDFARDEKLAPYMRISGFCFETTMTFFRDGTYRVEVDRSRLEETMDTLVEQLAGGMRLYLEDLLREQALDMTVEEYLAAVNLTPEDLLADAYNQETIDQMLSQLEMEGNFLVEEGKLYLSRDKRYAVNTAVWELYTVEADTLTIDVSSAEADNRYADLIYPMTFTRVTEEA